MEPLTHATRRAAAPVNPEIYDTADRRPIPIQDSTSSSYKAGPPHLAHRYSSTPPQSEDSDSAETDVHSGTESGEQGAGSCSSPMDDYAASEDDSSDGWSSPADDHRVSRIGEGADGMNHVRRGRRSGRDDPHPSLSFRSANSKIPKPSGEPGRPSSGGYSLEEVLQWGPQQYREVRSEARVAVYEEEAFRLFPIMEDYEDRWPIRAFATQRLHYLQNNARRIERNRQLDALQSPRGRTANR
ncbi:hypothetical protein HDZ31DRAFT_46627 [Schizophyllum fasciatum]